tara:strand:- start:452 stop:979 length:528 start_codon:yes stop_codon:yes gene_type:complete
MTGTLQVENIIGPTTGANTNTVTIPSTQTLDVSGGTLIPSAGAVVQQAEYFNDTTFTTTSNSFVTTLASVAITPKYSDSKMLIQVYGNSHAAIANGFRGSIRKDGTAFSHSGAEDLIAYAQTGSVARGNPVSVATIDNNVGTTNSVTYAYYIKTSDSSIIYFYRNYGIVVQEIKQ